MAIPEYSQTPSDAPRMDLPTELPKEVMGIQNIEDQNGSEQSSDTNNPYLTGWRLYITTIAVLICLYMVNIETTIVSTSLITITDSLHGFDRTSWVVTGYLITYTGCIILWSKLSDIIGRKPAIIATMTIFVAFSLGCGVSRSMGQLITCRAFQGIGSAGAYSLSVLLFCEIVPKRKLPLYGALAAMSIALGFSTGPLVGGALDDHSNWRWVFYINLPIGGVAIALLAIALPSSWIPYSLKEQRQHNHQHQHSILRTSLQRIDIVGAILLLTGSLPLIAALNEVYIQFRWSDSPTIALLALSGIAWIAFFAWEHLITRTKRGPEPIFPTRFLFHRQWMGMLFTTFLVGVPSTVVVVTLPQRFQIVNGTSPLSAGVRLLPYSSLSAVAAAVANLACKKGRIPFIYFFFLGSVLHTLGVALLSTLPENSHFPAAGYGYEILAGTGVGITFGILLLATPFVVEARDLSVATGAIIQFRFLGGALGLAIASNVLNGMLKSQLHGVLPPEQLQALLQNTAIIQTLTADQQQTVRAVFAHSYTIQYRIMIGFAAAQVPAAAFLWRQGRGATQLAAVED